LFYARVYSEHEHSTCVSDIGCVSLYKVLAVGHQNQKFSVRSKCTCNDR